MISYPPLPELCRPILIIKTDWTLPKPACLVPAPHLSITALHRVSTVNQVIWLNQLNYLPGEGGRRGVTHSIQFKKKEKQEGGEGGKRGRSIEVAILAKEIHKSGSKRLQLITAKLTVTRKFTIF